MASARRNPVKLTILWTYGREKAFCLRRVLSTVRLEPETMFTVFMIIFAFVTCSLFGLVIVSYMHANVLGVSFHMKIVSMSFIFASTIVR